MRQKQLAPFGFELLETVRLAIPLARDVLLPLGQLCQYCLSGPFKPPGVELHPAGASSTQVDLFTSGTSSAAPSQGLRKRAGE